MLKGAEAFALPCKYGQSLEIFRSEHPLEITWESTDLNGDTWFDAIFSLPDLGLIKTSDREIANSLQNILVRARELEPSFLPEAVKVKTKLDFPREWGLGSSSTLICNIAKWAEVNAFDLSENSFKGSGYDIAVGMTGSEVLYTYPPAWESLVWSPNFTSDLYFVHLNSKQNSREGIAYFEDKRFSTDQLEEISKITRAMINCRSLEDFSKLMQRHEDILSTILQIPPIKTRVFSDYPYAIKSLGAWGGDFILAIGDEHTKSYFKKKGYNTVLPYSEMIKQ